MTKQTRSWMICGTYTIGSVAGVFAAAYPWYYVMPASCLVYFVVGQIWDAFS